MAENEDIMKCNICEEVVQVSEQLLELLEHMKNNHKEIYKLHKANPEENVGFRIEYVEVDQFDAKFDPTTSAILIDVGDQDNENEQFEDEEDTKIEQKGKRYRSWVWKHYDRVNSFLHKCNHCQTILSVKRNNFHTLKRHLKARHVLIYKNEMQISTSMKELAEWTAQNTSENNDVKRRTRRSWVWNYFVPISVHRAQCNLCDTMISHGGTTTAPMARHLATLHKKHKQKRKLPTKVKSTKQNWVWLHFKRLSSTNAICNLCELQIDYEEDDTDSLVEHIHVEHEGMIKTDKTQFSGNWAWLYFNRLSSNKAECKLCDLQLVYNNDKEDLQRHLKENHKEKTLRPRRSWIWSYFTLTSRYNSKCNLCDTKFSHKGNCTGSLNRHLKYVHRIDSDSLIAENVTSEWIHKMFKERDDDSYSCRMCKFKCQKKNDEISTIVEILNHLKSVHNIDSDAQIVNEIESDGDDTE